MRLHRAAALIIVAMTLAGCIGASAQPSSAGTSPSEPIELPSASETGSLPPASGNAVPSDELGPFSCDLPVVEAATVALANITDVRVGTHASYDRVVFEFADGLPELTLDRATPPFTHDASGMPVEVQGDQDVIYAWHQGWAENGVLIMEFAEPGGPVPIGWIRPDERDPDARERQRADEHRALLESLRASLFTDNER